MISWKLHEQVKVDFGVIRIEYIREFVVDAVTEPRRVDHSQRDADTILFQF